DTTPASISDRADAWLEDVEFIIRNGTSKRALEERLGGSWNKIASRLRGRGRQDLIDSVVRQDEFAPARAA
ncbi:hypothetical protein, partial [Arthrobacter ginkgonis]